MWLSILFAMNIAYKPGSNKEITIARLKEFEKAVWEVNEELMNEFQDTANFIKYTSLSSGNAFGGQESGPHAGNLSVTLRDMEGAPGFPVLIFQTELRRNWEMFSDLEKIHYRSQQPLGCSCFD